MSLNVFHTLDTLTTHKTNAHNTHRVTCREPQHVTVGSGGGCWQAPGFWGSPLLSPGTQRVCIIVIMIGSNDNVNDGLCALCDDNPVDEWQYSHREMNTYTEPKYTFARMCTICYGDIGLEGGMFWGGLRVVVGSCLR